MYKEIQEIVLDDSSNEGNTRRVFIDTFDPLQVRVCLLVCVSVYMCVFIVKP